MLQERRSYLGACNVGSVTFWPPWQRVAASMDRGWSGGDWGAQDFMDLRVRTTVGSYPVILDHPGHPCTWGFVISRHNILEIRHFPAVSTGLNPLFKTDPDNATMGLGIGPWPEDWHLAPASWATTTSTGVQGWHKLSAELHFDLSAGLCE